MPGLACRIAPHIVGRCVDVLLIILRGVGQAYPVAAFIDLPAAHILLLVSAGEVGAHHAAQSAQLVAIPERPAHAVVGAHRYVEDVRRGASGGIPRARGCLGLIDRADNLVLAGPGRQQGARQVGASANGRLDLGVERVELGFAGGVEHVQQVDRFGMPDLVHRGVVEEEPSARDLQDAAAVAVVRGLIRHRRHPVRADGGLAQIQPAH